MHGWTTDWFAGSGLGENRAMGAATAGVSVVIACHTRERLDFLTAAVESALGQLPPPDAVVVSVDHEPVLAGMVAERFPQITVVENAYDRGASGTRNTGADHTSTPLIAFLDDDARARPGWLSALTEPFADRDVVCYGRIRRPGMVGR